MSCNDIERAEQEIWKTIPNYEYYEVSNFGRVRSWRSRVRDKGTGKMVRRDEPQILRPGRNGRGYLQVSLTNEDGVRSLKVHRLVLSAFTGEEPDGMQAAHGNGIRTDNRLSNLRWATPGENAADKVLHGTENHGSKHRNAKLTEEIVQEVRQLYIPRHPEFGAAALAKRYGVTRRTMHYAITGTTWSTALVSTENPDDMDLTA